MTRRRADRDTVPEPFVSMRELAVAWHAQLNSTGPHRPNPSPVDENGLRGRDLSTQSTQEG